MCARIWSLKMHRNNICFIIFFKTNHNSNATHMCKIKTNVMLISILDILFHIFNFNLEGGIIFRCFMAKYSDGCCSICAIGLRLHNSFVFLTSTVYKNRQFYKLLHMIMILTVRSTFLWVLMHCEDWKKLLMAIMANKRNRLFSNINYVLYLNFSITNIWIKTRINVIFSKALT